MHYIKTHKAAGGKVKKGKVSLHCWKWEDQMITNEAMRIKFKNETIANHK